MSFYQLIGLIGILICLGVSVWFVIEEYLYRRAISKRLIALEKKLFK